jgi:hypothetical protein
MLLIHVEKNTGPNQLYTLVINKNNPNDIIKEKILHTQLNSEKRAEICRLLVIEHSNTALYSQIDHLHLNMEEHNICLIKISLFLLSITFCLAA